MKNYTSFVACGLKTFAPIGCEALGHHLAVGVPMVCAATDPLIVVEP